MVFEGVQGDAEQVPDARRQMDNARNRVFDAVDDAQTVMRDELASL